MPGAHDLPVKAKEFDVPKATYYTWKKIFDKDGTDGLLKNHPVAYNHPSKIKEEVIEKVLLLRKEYAQAPGASNGTWSGTMILLSQSPVFLEY